MHSLSLRKGDLNMDRSFEELEAIVRNRICGVCTERTNEGQCGLEEPVQLRAVPSFPPGGPGHSIGQQRRHPASTSRPSGATSVRSVRNRRRMAPAKRASRCNARSMRICCWWWTPSKRPPARPSTKPASARYRRARPFARARKFGCEARIWRSFMNFNLLPLLVVWTVLALAVLALFVWRQIGRQQRRRHLCT